MKIAVIGCVIDNPKEINCEFNSIVEDHKDIVVARMGVPMPAENISVLSFIVKGELDRINHLCGILGKIPTVNVKISFSKKEID